MELLRNARRNPEAKITRIFLNWVAKHGPDDDYVGYRWKGVDMKRTLYRYMNTTKLQLEVDAEYDGRMLNLRQLPISDIVARPRGNRNSLLSRKRSVDEIREDGELSRSIKRHLARRSVPAKENDYKLVEREERLLEQSGTGSGPETETDQRVRCQAFASAPPWAELDLGPRLGKDMNSRVFQDLDSDSEVEFVKVVKSAERGSDRVMGGGVGGIDALSHKEAPVPDCHPSFIVDAAVNSASDGVRYGTIEGESEVIFVFAVFDLSIVLILTSFVVRAAVGLHRIRGGGGDGGLRGAGAIRVGAVDDHLCEDDSVCYSVDEAALVLCKISEGGGLGFRGDEGKDDNWTFLDSCGEDELGNDDCFDEEEACERKGREVSASASEEFGEGEELEFDREDSSAEGWDDDCGHDESLQTKTDDSCDDGSCDGEEKGENGIGGRTGGVAKGAVDADAAGSSCDGDKMETGHDEEPEFRRGEEVDDECAFASGGLTCKRVGVVVKSEWFELRFWEQASISFVDLFYKCAALVQKDAETLMFSLTGQEYYPICRADPSFILVGYGAIGLHFTLHLCEGVTIYVVDLANDGREHRFLCHSNCTLWGVLESMRSLHHGAARFSLLTDSTGRFVYAGVTAGCVNLEVGQTLYYWHSPTPRTPIISLFLNYIGEIEEEEGLRPWTMYEGNDAMNFVVNSDDGIDLEPVELLVNSDDDTA